MTTTFDDLLQDIRKTPHDTGLRLIYADWLDEQGDAAQAEFVRVQCLLARLEEENVELGVYQQRNRERLARAHFSQQFYLDNECPSPQVCKEYPRAKRRQQELWWDHYNSWYPHIATIQHVPLLPAVYPRRGTMVYLRNGFPSEAHCSSSDFLQQNSYLERWPLTDVYLTTELSLEFYGSLDESTRRTTLVALSKCYSYEDPQFGTSLILSDRELHGAVAGVTATLTAAHAQLRRQVTDEFEKHWPTIKFHWPAT